MKLNRQFQDLHVEQPSADWVRKQLVERDICLLYHQLANYSFIMDGLYYGDVFALPYWDCLEMQGVDLADQAFIRDGCLVMILAMASECLGGSGAYLLPHVEACKNSLARLTALDAETQQLVQTIQQVLHLLDDNIGRPPPEFADGFGWVHERYVRRYFTKRAEDFRDKPYYRGS